MPSGLSQSHQEIAGQFQRELLQLICLGSGGQHVQRPLPRGMGRPIGLQCPCNSFTRQEVRGASDSTNQPIENNALVSSSALSGGARRVVYLVVSYSPVRSLVLTRHSWANVPRWGAWALRLASRLGSCSRCCCCALSRALELPPPPFATRCCGPLPGLAFPSVWLARLTNGAASARRRSRRRCRRALAHALCTDAPQCLLRHPRLAAGCPAPAPAPAQRAEPLLPLLLLRRAFPR